MSTDNPAPSPETLTLQHVERLAEAQSLDIDAGDLANVHRQLQLIASHASLVMEFDLDEEIEPAGEFRP